MRTFVVIWPSFAYFLSLTLSWIESHLKNAVTRHATQIHRTQNIVSVIHHGTTIFCTDGRFVYINNWSSVVTRKRQNQIFRALKLPFSSFQRDYVTYFSAVIGSETVTTDKQYILIDTVSRKPVVYHADKLVYFGSELIIEVRQERGTPEDFGFEPLV